MRELDSAPDPDPVRANVNLASARAFLLSGTKDVEYLPGHRYPVYGLSDSALAP